MSIKESVQDLLSAIDNLKDQVFSQGLSDQPNSDRYGHVISKLSDLYSDSCHIKLELLKIEPAIFED